MKRRTFIAAAPVAVLAGPLPVNPDADLLADCATYHKQSAICNDHSSTQAESDVAYDLLTTAFRRIEATTPRTPAGHCAWLRAMFDSYGGSEIPEDVRDRIVAVAHSVHGIAPPAA